MTVFFKQFGHFAQRGDLRIVLKIILVNSTVHGRYNNIIQLSRPRPTISIVVTSERKLVWSLCNWLRSDVYSLHTPMMPRPSVQCQPNINHGLNMNMHKLCFRMLKVEHKIEVIRSYNVWTTVLSRLLKYLKKSFTEGHTIKRSTNSSHYRSHQEDLNFFLRVVCSLRHPYYCVRHVLKNFSETNTLMVKPCRSRSDCI